MKLLKIFFPVLFSLIQVALVAQTKISPDINLRDKQQLHQLVTNRGDQFLGRILYLDGNKVRFELNSGSIITYKLEEISELAVINRETEEITDEQFFYPFSELFISRTAFNLSQGQKQFQNSQLILSRFDFAATDNYSIGVGYIMPYSLLLKSKIATNNESFFNFAAGLDFVFGLSGEETSQRLFHFYGVTTIGNRSNFINISPGIVIPLRTPENTSRVRTPLFISIGGVFSVSEQWKVIVDTLYLDQLDRSWYPGIGLSFLLGRNRFDGGLFYFSDFISEPVSAPGVGYMITF
ncbi:MAG: hypothetical protein MRY78_20180 [Saprospiraceae bacterium]|nr:hypothetical protein [Saprospiraceae bacterium]